MAGPLGFGARLLGLAACLAVVSCGTDTREASREATAPTAPRARATTAGPETATAAPAIGWAGEPLPARMRRGAAAPVVVLDTGKGLEIAMVYVPPGDFLMGADDGHAAERPAHAHPVPEGYYIGRTETTWAQFRAYCRATGADEPEAPAWGARDDHPVVNVSWEEAQAFCAWAGLALPSEAQWERAARGTDGRAYPWGDDAPTADLCVASSFSTTGPVGSAPRGVSPVGALDMAGNVWEWCADWFDSDAYARYAKGDPTPPASGEVRVNRGGGWYGNASDCRTTDRDYDEPEKRGHTIGFRPVRPARG